jgi:hypothetical protein
VEEDHYVQKLAVLLEVRASAVRQDLKKYRSENSKAPTTLRAHEHASAPAAKKPKTAQQKKERYAWFVLLNDDPAKAPAKKLQLQAATLTWNDEAVREIAAEFLAFKPQFSLETFNQFLSTEKQKMLAELYLDPELVEHLGKIDLTEEWQKTWQELKKDQIKNRLKKISVELELLDAQEQKTPADEERQEELLREILGLQKQMKL